MTTVQLNLVVIRAEDIDRAAKFYSILGLEFHKHRHGTGPEHCASETGGIVFEIYPPKQGESSAGTRIGFQIPSIDAVIAGLEAAGARIISPATDSPWGRRAVIADLDGHRVELTEPH
ncbi:VOC family protein [Capsulimonas corticalis]|nr:VOC family protein [Capsulimonas corticalis]